MVNWVITYWLFNQVNPIEINQINQVEQEIEAKLKLLCSKEAIEAEVHLMWSLNSKQAKRVQIRTKDKEEAEKSIRKKNYQKIRQEVEVVNTLLN